MRNIFKKKTKWMILDTHGVTISCPMSLEEGFTYLENTKNPDVLLVEQRGRNFIGYFWGNDQIEVVDEETPEEFDERLAEELE